MEAAYSSGVRVMPLFAPTQNIAPAKLKLLLNLAEQIEGKSQKEAMPVIMGAIASANRQRLNFTKDEFDLIFQIMKEGKSEEEKRQMDDALAKARKMMRGKDGR